MSNKKLPENATKTEAPSSPAVEGAKYPPQRRYPT